MVRAPVTVRPRQRLTGSGKAMLTVALVLLVGLLVAVLSEGLVRLRQWWRYGNLWSVEETFHLDAATGLRIPTANMVKGPIRINALGFRSPEVTMPKPPTTIRLAFLGGSTTYCAEVSSNEATWPHLVWQRLQRALPDTPVDYVNGGVPGYSVINLFRNLELRVRPLQPDVIVIYEAANDLSADTYELARRRGLVSDRQGESPSWLSRHSFLWFLVTKNLTILYRQGHADAGTGKLTFNPRELSRGFRSRLTSLIRASQATAPVVAVSTFAWRLRRSLPPDERRKAAVTSLYFMPYMSIEGLLEGSEEYNRVIREVAKDTGAILIDGDDRIPPDGIHYTDSVHFTDAGSRVMAERVAASLLGAPSLRALVSRCPGCGNAARPSTASAEPRGR
jgi:lysophospholipase L1-like esterase